jgi:hypothetical protein
MFLIETYRSTRDSVQLAMSEELQSDDISLPALSESTYGSLLNSDDILKNAEDMIPILSQTILNISRIFLAGRYHYPEELSSVRCWIILRIWLGYLSDIICDLIASRRSCALCGYDVLYRSCSGFTSTRTQTGDSSSATNHQIRRSQSYVCDTG